MLSFFLLFFVVAGEKDGARVGTPAPTTHTRSLRDAQAPEHQAAMSLLHT